MRGLACSKRRTQRGSPSSISRLSQTRSVSAAARTQKTQSLRKIASRTAAIARRSIRPVRYVPSERLEERQPLHDAETAGRIEIALGEGEQRGQCGLTLFDGVAERCLQRRNQPKHAPDLMARVPTEFSYRIRMDRRKRERACRKAEEVEHPRGTRLGVPAA